MNSDSPCSSRQQITQVVWSLNWWLHHQGKLYEMEFKMQWLLRHLWTPQVVDLGLCNEFASLLREVWFTRSMVTILQNTPWIMWRKLLFAIKLSPFTSVSEWPGPLCRIDPIIAIYNVCSCSVLIKSAKELRELILPVKQLKSAKELRERQLIWSRLLVTCILNIQSVPIYKSFWLF